MSIDMIIERRDALTKAIDQGLAFAKPEASVFAQPIAQQESYIASLTSRIDALEALRQQQNDRIDSDVKALKADLDAANVQLASDRRVLAPASGKTDTPAKNTAPRADAKGKTKPK
jgi:uncharacterized protein (DUF3084 family)